MVSEMLRRFIRPLAQFNGLTLQVADPRRELPFWGDALGGRVDWARNLIIPGPGRPAREVLRLRQTDVLLPVDDARVHVDLRLPGSTPDRLLEAGARVVRAPGEDPWYVLMDVEDNEFCAFPAADDRPAGIFELVVKTSDALGSARWWARVLDGQVIEEGDAAVVVGAPDFPWDYLVFDPVPGVERFRSRMRWDLLCRDRDVSGFLEIGATVTAEPEEGMPFWVLADPGGNEFQVICDGVTDG